MISKVLGQEIADLEERKNFLIDNADSVVEMDYHKSFESEELARKKTELSEVCIQINDLEEEIKQYRENVNLELKPLKETRQTLLADIKSKGKMVREKCYCFIEQQEKMACFYNAEGILVSSRPATREELKAPTIFQKLRKEA
jgi:hypothetical protein